MCIVKQWFIIILCITGKDFKRQVIKVENQPPFCGKHKELLQYFCNDPSCSQLLCYQCLGTGDHSKHEWMELNQAMISMKTRLEQAGHATKEAAIATQRQMDALCKEEDRLQSKCETAKASIHTNIGDIRSQLDDRKAHFESNLKHATQCHSFLKHKISRETLSTEEVVLHELQTNGKDILARLNSRDPMSLGETEKTRDRLKEAQDTVAQIKKQCSSPTSQFKANPNEVRTKLSNYGKIMVDTFEQGSHSQSSSIEPYEPVFRSKQRPQSAIDLQSLATSQRSCFSKVYSKIQRPPVPKKPFLRRQSADVIHAIRKSGYRVYPLEQSSLTVHNIPLLNRTMARGFEIEEKRLSNVCSSSQEEHEEIYDDPASPPLPPRTFSLPRAPPFPPPPPPSKDGTTVAIQSQFNDEELYEEVDAS